MTHLEMQTIITSSMAEQLQNQLDIRKRINTAFRAWFQGLLASAAPSPMPPAESGQEGAPSEAGAEPSPNPEGAPPI